jgi:hypothetical protein
MKAAAVLVLLGACGFGVALFLFPVHSDAAFANYDGLWYGMNAERAGARCIVAHHMLFHVAVMAVLPPLRAFGVENPGGVACRIVAGLGAAALLLLVASRARNRLIVGAGFALMLLASRTFIVEAATGENVLPACALGLGALIVAARPSPSLGKVGAALTVALLFRQDNVLLVPAIVYALWSGLPPERRAPRILGTLVVSGAVVVVASILAWLVARAPGQTLLAYVYDIGSHDWSVPIAGPRMLAHADAFGIAAVGRHWSPDDHHLWIGGALLATTLAAAWLLRGDGSSSRFRIACALALAARLPFFIWFEPHNPEWHVMTWALVAACGADAAAGFPRTALRVRVLGGALLLALPVVFLVAHGPHTWLLRRHDMLDAVRALGDTTGADVFAEEHHVGAAFSVLGLPRTVLTGSRAENERFLFETLMARPRPMVFVIDRMVFDGMPYSLDHLSEYDHHLDLRDGTPDLRLERWKGRVYAFRYTPEGTTRPSK